jgi:hypothetical protein
LRISHSLILSIFSFRDLLHTKYKSSTKAKANRRKSMPMQPPAIGNKEKRVKQADVTPDVNGNKTDQGVNKLLSIPLPLLRNDAPEEQIIDFFNTANNKLLLDIKRRIANNNI